MQEPPHQQVMKHVALVETKKKPQNQNQTLAWDVTNIDTGGKEQLELLGFLLFWESQKSLANK